MCVFQAPSGPLVLQELTVNLVLMVRKVKHKNFYLNKYDNSALLYFINLCVKGEPGLMGEQGRQGLQGFPGPKGKNTIYKYIPVIIKYVLFIIHLSILCGK